MQIELSRIARGAWRRGSSMLTRPLAPAARRYLGVIRSVATEEALVALTFDDGPHPEHTPALLALLAQYKATATFFMIGELAVKHPDIVHAVAQQGHSIANHSWSHLSFPLLTARELHEQLRLCEEALSPYGGKLFRPPYCHQSVSSRWHTLLSGYDVVTFSVHAEDWLPRSPEWMAARLVRETRPGAIIILHDNIYRSCLPASQYDRRPMLCALQSALEQLGESFRFVTIPELLRHGSPVRETHFESGLPEMQPTLRRCLVEQRRGVRSTDMPPQ